MKNTFLKIVIVLLAIVLLSMGLVPCVNGFLKNHITYETYLFLMVAMAFTAFELMIYLKFHSSTEESFNIMKAEFSFTKYKKMSRYKEDNSFFYRDLPLNKDIFKIFWIAYQYNIINNKACILNALLLKWCKENRIRFISKGRYQIIDSNKPFDNSNEFALFYLLTGANTNKFIKLGMFNYKTIFKKIDDILIKETRAFEKENKVVLHKGKYLISDAIIADVDTVFGFKNFLLNFGSIEEKLPQEVIIWEEYLIYAELLGIADKVKQELRRANIDYSSSGKRIKRINTRFIIFFRVLLAVSYLFYGLMFLIFTSFIWMIYAQLTWN